MHFPFIDLSSVSADAKRNDIIRGPERAEGPGRWPGPSGEVVQGQETTPQPVLRLPKPYWVRTPAPSVSLAQT